jgi:methyl-accepting chemotaxis protein
MPISFSGDCSHVLKALGKSQAIIEFALDGTILTANENFLNALGYQLHEIVGKHHRLFVDPEEASTQAYKDFWARLACGEFDLRRYKRIAKDGRTIWIEASYNPVFRGSKPYKVVKIATDVTEQTVRTDEDSSKLEAISRAQAVIEFTPAGDILTANENFLNTLGYTLEEIKGRHHSMFCDKDYGQSAGYRDFWKKLGAGELVAGEFMRLGKGGRPVHIQASYNPIFDLDGRVAKVVKFATDVSTRVANVEVLATAMKALASGDLTQAIREPFLPALERLRVDFNEACHRLGATMTTISGNASAIAAASSEIQSASNDLAHRTEQQAASVEETAAALEEITTTVNDASHRAQEAGELVRVAKKNAEESGFIVRKAVTAMGEIQQASLEISNIIDVIDRIAFQTNLLALNAGVEAARAGDAGKGFAVVAQEVRQLAHRSALAAKEITSLITTSNQLVSEGVHLVNTTGATLQSMVAQVIEVDGNVGAIAKSAVEQATGLREINTAVNTIDHGTQQNAAMVEETSAAAHSLAREAAELFEQLSQFTLATPSAKERRTAEERSGPAPTKRIVEKRQVGFR